MPSARREFIKIGDDLALDFANTVQAEGRDATGRLHSWSGLIDFLELRGALTRTEAVDLRAMGESDARRCAAAFGQSVQLRDTLRAMLGFRGG